MFNEDDYPFEWQKKCVRWQKRHPFITFLIIVIAVLVTVYCLNDASENTPDLFKCQYAGINCDK